MSRRAFVGLAGLEAAASNILSFGGHRLTVAAMPRLAAGLLTRAVTQFKAGYPESLVTIHSGTAASVNTWMSSSLCDVGLAIIYGDDSPGLRAETLFSMDCVIVLPKAHRLSRLKQVQAADLEGEAFISFPVGSAPRARIDQVLAAAGVRPRTVLESDLGASVCALVAAGLGVSVINPLAALEERRASDLEIRHSSRLYPSASPCCFRLLRRDRAWWMPSRTMYAGSFSRSSRPSAPSAGKPEAASSRKFPFRLPGRPAHESLSGLICTTTQRHGDEFANPLARRRAGNGTRTAK
jgi:DNA-binding transcriptional LysR family regulator